MRYVFFILILSGLYELVFGIKQIFITILNNYSNYYISGTFSNPAPYAMFITIIIPFAWFTALQAKEYLMIRGNIFKKIEIILSICYVLLSLIILPLTFNRTSWIATILACTIVTFDYSSKIRDKRFCCRPLQGKCNIIIFIILFLIFMCCTYLLKKSSADGRLLIWKISSSILKENIVNGVGRGNFPGVYGSTQEEYFRNNKGTEHEKFIAGAPEYTYNEYLQIVIEYGIIGLLSLMFIVGYCFYHIKHVNNQSKIPIMGAFISLLVISFSSYPFRNFYTCLLSILVISLAMFLHDEKKSLKNIYINYSILILILFTVYYRVHVSFGAWGNVKTAYKQWNMIKPYFNSGHLEDLADNYEILYPYLKTDAAFLFEYAQCMSYIGKYEKSNQILHEGLCISSDPMFLNILGKNYQQLKKYQLAEDMFYKAYYRIPHKIYPLYLLMLLYKEQKKEQCMLTMAYRIVNQKEKVDSPETRFIKAKVREMLSQVE